MGEIANAEIKVGDLVAYTGKPKIRFTTGTVGKVVEITGRWVDVDFDLGNLAAVEIHNLSFVSREETVSDITPADPPAPDVLTISPATEPTNLEWIEELALRLSIIADHEGMPDAWRQYRVGNESKAVVIDRAENSLTYRAREVAKELAEMESKLAAAEKRVAELEAALTPFALAADDIDIAKAGYDRPLCVSTWSHALEEQIHVPISIENDDDDDPIESTLFVSHLRHARKALKAGTP